MTQSVFRSAIDDGEGSVDAGYLALFWIMAAVITAIPFMCLLVLAAWWADPLGELNIQALGIAIGSACGGFGVAVAAVGVFRQGDKPRLPVVDTTVTSTSQSSVHTEVELPTKRMK